MFIVIIPVIIFSILSISFIVYKLKKKREINNIELIEPLL